MRNAVLRCNNRKKAPFSHWLNVDFVWVYAAFFLIVMMSWWCNVISGKWCNKCDSVWILESRCIGSIMRHINLGWTKYDVTEDLGVKCTSSPSSRGCTCQSHRARVSHPTFSTNYFMFTHFHINILPAKAAQDVECAVPAAASPARPLSTAYYYKHSFKVSRWCNTHVDDELECEFIQGTIQ